jgi:small multidrug resistance pump
MYRRVRRAPLALPVIVIDHNGLRACRCERTVERILVKTARRIQAQASLCLPFDAGKLKLRTDHKGLATKNTGEASGTGLNLVRNDTVRYLYLTIAIVAEVIGTVTLKSTDNFTKLAPSCVVVVCYGIAFFMLSLIVRSMPVGIVYAIWSGAGIVLVTITGAIWLGQSLDFAATIGIALILAGVVIVNLFSKSIVH